MLSYVPWQEVVDRLAYETVELVTTRHRGILRAVVDAYRDVVTRVITYSGLPSPAAAPANEDQRRTLGEATAAYSLPLRRMSHICASSVTIPS
jgi:hypothetical protein